MSYCRWSSDDFKSAIYAYADVSGCFAIHVAAKKRVGHIPPLPDIMKVSAKEFADAVNHQIAVISKLPMEPIGLPCDGQSFHEPTIEAAIVRMKALRDMGYHVPADAIESMEEEAKESQ